MIIKGWLIRLPTGYTAMLDDNPDISTKRWFMEGLTRAFGVCICLRDDPMNLSEQEILKRITQSDQQTVDYHALELGKAVKERAAIESRTKDQWQTLYQAELKHIRNYNKKQLSKASKMKARHDAALADLQKIVADKDADEVTINIAKFGIEQLDVVKDECKPYLYDILTFPEFQAEVIRKNARDLTYHDKELESAKERYQERIDVYQNISKDINRILG